jgi:probable HAF family extracellular repeat protein
MFTQRAPVRTQFVLLIAATCGPMSASAIYAVTDLGTLGGCCAAPYAINNAGQVTGISALLGNPVTHAFLYSGGTMHDLGSLGAFDSFGYAINDLGQVAGAAIVSQSPEGSHSVWHAFLYRNGVMTDLGTLGGSNSYAWGINKDGQVVGYSDVPGDSESHAFLYSNGKMTDLGTVGVASDINDSGQITGNGPSGAFLYANGQFTVLPTLGGVAGARSINEVGQVAGFSGGHAFLYTNGVMQDLGVPPGGFFSEAFGVNNAGQVVGAFASPDPVGSEHAFLFSDGSAIDLNTTIDPTLGLTLMESTDINDLGQIVASARLRDGRGAHAVLLTPRETAAVPEPATYTFVGCGALLVAVAVRNKRSRGGSTVPDREHARSCS